ncbi:MMPL family transporter [Pseudoduganella sp. RAF19]|uniref:hopanoid transporter HpnN n=1 Tax=Pseudoduganella sp. RAF19 TaxID=3233052 RepID=UPI003F94A40F
MLTALLIRLVRIAVHRAGITIAVASVLTLLSGIYAARHFAIDTDIDRLLESNAPWALRDAAIDKAFPQRRQMILAVVQAPARELADAAADALAADLETQTQRFRTVSRPGGGEYFGRAGLMFLPTEEVQKLTAQLQEAKPLIGLLQRDPSLRGLSDTLSTTLALPLQLGQVKLEDMASLLERSAAAIEGTLAGQHAALSWMDLDTQPKDKPTQASAFVAITPKLDFANLAAGGDASDLIRASAARLDLSRKFNATVRLTGPQPLADEEFASVAEGAILNGVLTLLLVIVILWLALRSTKLIAAVLISLIAGLIVTAALGLAMVGSLNMISVAFAVLFIGLGGDFGIQFGVRYRAERHEHPTLHLALERSAAVAGGPLALAAAATALAFFCFLPTDYRGVAELGLIAGAGMLVAFFFTLTLLPALISVFRPHGEPTLPSVRWLAPADEFFERHRNAVLIGAGVLILAGVPLLTHLRFDFDPLNLKDPNSESMATLRALADAPEAGTEDVSVLAPSLDDAQKTAKRLAAVPEVLRTITLYSLVPEDQEAKLPLISAASAVLSPILAQPTAAAASDALRVAALKRLGSQLELAAEDHPGAGSAPALRLAKAVQRLAGADPRQRDRAEAAIALPLRLSLARLQLALQAQPVSVKDVPPALVRDWVTPDGRALVSITPRLPAPDSDDFPDTLDQFIDAVLRADPRAASGPISVRGSADTIMGAFGKATGYALLSITLLLWITLRRFGDVLRTLVPLLVSTLVTLEVCVLIDLPLNFANVIALPLLLGVGVAFKIYYVMAWRAGQTHLLQSSLTHAVLFSAATTAAAFGSLSFSHHPGTASMGQLLALALACTLIGAVFFQPILLGRPRDTVRTPIPPDLQDDEGSLELVSSAGRKTSVGD